MLRWNGSSAIVADDHELFRAALAERLRREFSFCSVIEVSSLDEAVDCLGRTPNVAIACIDLAMPGMDGAASLHAMREVYPDIRVAVITASETSDDILQALGAGVHGYVPKAFRTAEIMMAIHAVLEGKMFIPSTLAAKVAASQRPSPTRIIPQPHAMHPVNGPSKQGLSPRQKQVLELIARGSSNKQIARALHLAEGTVKVHVAALFRALGAHNRVSAVVATTQQRLSVAPDGARSSA